MKTEGIGFGSSYGSSLRYRIGVNGDEEVGLGIVGYLCPFVQGYEDVLLSGIDDVDIRMIVLDEFAQFQGNVQVDGLLLASLADGTWVTASMTGVDDYRETSAFCL
jgi:hypothetical protein